MTDIPQIWFWLGAEARTVMDAYLTTEQQRIEREAALLTIDLDDPQSDE